MLAEAEENLQRPLGFGQAGKLYSDHGRFEEAVRASRRRWTLNRRTLRLTMIWGCSSRSQVTLIRRVSTCRGRSIFALSIPTH